MTIYAWSDLHVDFPRNLSIIESLNKSRYHRDTIIIAGDLTDRLPLLQHTLSTLAKTFAHVFFVAGNHDLWLRKEDFECSVDKYHAIEKICQQLGVHTNAEKITSDEHEAVWIVPLVSWYTKPEEGEDSLFVRKIGEDPSLRMWMDNYRTKWPSLQHQSPAKHFLSINEDSITVNYDAPVISFSHFLPSRELIFPGLLAETIIQPYENDPHPEFNFTRVAGSSRIQEQIDRLDSVIHYYGHQHRNKRCDIDGVTYISHCMGYPQESRYGETGDKLEPVSLWPRPTGI
jgi:DNA repair exonuclease SbcCD nuclease subunit